jgi:hypothetical protein
VHELPTETSSDDTVEDCDGTNDEADDTAESNCCDAERGEGDE